ncbi:MAG: three-Cys-motif partner protein TcmP [Sterolibacteriaceae bacterium]|nr:three-Cys-motif partner protein TcmP [Candidatus Methylophosphatis haderslevensis]
MAPQQFGGAWTEEKLNALQEYLRQYLQIFDGNPAARKLTRHYVDAFAGSGLRALRRQERGGIHQPELEIEFEEVARFADGSVKKALSLESAFHHYHLVERDPDRVAELRTMIRREFAQRSDLCSVVCEDANAFLSSWTDALGPLERAVVFLDPYGMAVDWATIAKLGRTQKVDLWMLFPMSAVIRMLPNSGPPSDEWAKVLDRTFGTRDWIRTFYPVDTQGTLFDPVTTVRRDVDVDLVGEFFRARLAEAFYEVAPKALTLYNSRRSPLFQLVFAAANPKGAVPAIRIANHILGKA